VRPDDDLHILIERHEGSAEDAQRRTAGNRRVGAVRRNCGILVTFVLRTAFSNRASFLLKDKLRKSESDSGVAKPGLGRLRQCSLKTCLKPNRS
jgi:hypothetical protein